MEVTLNINYVLIFVFISAFLLFKCISLYRQNNILEKDYEEANDDAFNFILKIVELSKEHETYKCKQEEFRCYCRDTQSYVQHLEELLKINNINIDRVKSTQAKIEEEDSLINTVVP